MQIININQLRKKRNTKQVAKTLVRLLNRHRTNPKSLDLESLESLIRAEIERRE